MQPDQIVVLVDEVAQRVAGRFESVVFAAKNLFGLQRFEERLRDLGAGNGQD